MPRPIEDLTGRVFGSWTVIALHSERSTNGETNWLCRCSCGAQAFVLRSNLTRGKSTQCVDCRIRASRKPPRPKHIRPRVQLVGAAHPRWKGNMIVYSSAHKRVAAARGPASGHRCVDCGEPARDWSFSKVECETRMVDATNRPYCTHPEHYEPRCRDCHSHFDHP